jgi:hypothetical protein
MRPSDIYRHPLERSRSAPDRLVDDVIERYVDWREAAVAADLAYGAWAQAPAAEGAGLFDAYCAALDHEEAAARLYRLAIDRLTQHST